MEAGGDPPDLTALGWCQGSLLPPEVRITSTMWVHPDVQLDVRAKKAVGNKEDVFSFERPRKDKDRFAVVTQTCDVIKPSALLPQVEVARAFLTASGPTISQARNFGSARYFLLEEAENGEAWVLDHGARTFVDKGFLVACDPDNAIVSEWSAEQEATFSRWVGRRNGRPALSDADVAEICDPVRRRIETLTEEEPEAAERYTREFAEFRYRREADGSVSIFLLSSNPAPDELLALEVMDVLNEALAHLPNVRLVSDKLSYSTFTKADELSTQQIDLYWASHDEGEASGAIPPD